MIMASEQAQEQQEQAVAMSATGLSLSYTIRGQALPVLDDLSLSIARGEFVVLLGPSGCGKSTLLNVFAGLEQPAAGQVCVGSGSARPEAVAYMQQKDLLLPWRTVWRNILLASELQGIARRPPASTEAKAAKWLETFQLAHFRNAYPAELSGGMRQRVALIRTLLAEREVLLLDEPFGAVDALTRRRLQAHLIQVWSSLQKTVLLVTHDVEEALLLANRIVLMTGRPGRIVEEITHLPPHGVRATAPEIPRLKAHILEQLEVAHGL